MNQVFLFLGGFLIGLFFQNIKISNLISLGILIVGLGLFIFYPVSGPNIKLVTGVNRLVFTLSCFLICLSFYKITFQFPKFIHKPLSILGESSYSIYLLHPIAYTAIGIILTIISERFFHFSESLYVIIPMIATVVMSYFVYNYFEKYFMKFGRSKTKPNSYNPIKTDSNPE